MSSDNGSEFTSLDMAALLLRYGVEQRFSLPYQPKTSGAVERFNQSLKMGLNKVMLETNSKVWLVPLQHVTYQYNTTIHGTTKQTPFRVMFGRDVKTSMLQQLVADRIRDSADKMVRLSTERYKATSEPLQEGDFVRVSAMALKEERKRTKLQKKSFVQWSEQIYKVDDIKEGKRSVSGLDTQYAVVDLDGGRLKEGGKERLFFRHQLYKVGDPGDEDKVEKPQ